MNATPTPGGVIVRLVAGLAQVELCCPACGLQLTQARRDSIPPQCPRCCAVWR